MIWVGAGAAVALAVIWASYRLTHRRPPAEVAATELVDPAELRSRDDFDHDLHERRESSGTTASIVVTLAGYDALVADHGEQVGLDLRSATTRALAASIRDNDVSYGFADDEFAVLLTGAEANGARRVAHRIRRNIERDDHGFGFGAVTATLDSSTGQTRVTVAARVDSTSS